MKHIFTAANAFIAKIENDLPKAVTKDIKLLILNEAETLATKAGFGVFVFPLLEEMKAAVNAE